MVLYNFRWTLGGNKLTVHYCQMKVNKNKNHIKNHTHLEFGIVIFFPPLYTNQAITPLLRDTL